MKPLQPAASEMSERNCPAKYATVLIIKDRQVAEGTLIVFLEPKQQRDREDHHMQLPFPTLADGYPPIADQALPAPQR